MNDQIDERLHRQKATIAGLDYLEKLYNQFGSWHLAFAAYNRGEAGLTRDMESQFVDNYHDIWLNKETARYVFRIAAIKYAMEHINELVPQDLLENQYELPNTITLSLNSVSDLRLRASNN